MPLAWHGVAERVKPPLGVKRRFVHIRKYDAARAHCHGYRSRLHDPIAHGPRCLVAAASDHGRPLRKAGLARRRLRDPPGHLRGFVTSGEPVLTNPERAEDVMRPPAVLDIEEEGA